MSKQEVSPEYVEALHNKIEALEERVDELESGDEGPAQSSGWGDHRDRAVADSLTVGESYGPMDLISRYKAKTDIRNRATLKRRAKDLHRSPLFDRGTFVGDDDE